MKRVENIVTKDEIAHYDNKKISSCHDVFQMSSVEGKERNLYMSKVSHVYKSIASCKTRITKAYNTM